VDFVAYRSDAGAHDVFEVAVFVLKGTLRRGKNSARQRDGSRFYAVFVDIDAKIAYPGIRYHHQHRFSAAVETPGPTSQTIPSSISSAILLDIVAEVILKF
jgi:ligand-binding SRPBCC domain-containing protein